MRLHQSGDAHRVLANGKVRLYKEIKAYLQSWNIHEGSSSLNISLFQILEKLWKGETNVWCVKYSRSVWDSNV